MTLRDASGNILNKTELTAKTTQAPVVQPDRIFSENIYETYSLSGEGDRFESGRRLKYAAGRRITQTAFDALFKTATVTSISPATGLAAGGTNVTIKGTGLAGVEGVTFDGAAATNVKVVDDSTVTCTTPAGTAGPADVVVADDNANVTKTAFYTYS